MLELHAIAAKKVESGANFAVAMTAVEKRRFVKSLTQNANAFYDMLGNVDLEASHCSRPADRDGIHTGIRNSVGFAVLSRMVLGVLEDWIYAQLKEKADILMTEGKWVEAIEWNALLATQLLGMGKDGNVIKLFCST